MVEFFVWVSDDAVLSVDFGYFYAMIWMKWLKSNEILNVLYEVDEFLGNVIHNARPDKK